MTQEEQKQAAAEAALEFIELGSVVGVGTGSTTNYFIDALAQVKGKLDGAVACLLYTSPSPRDYASSRMPSSA